MSFPMLQSTQMRFRLFSILFVAIVSASPATADHHDSFEFLNSFQGVWDATEGEDGRGTMTFVQGTSDQTLYIQGEMGANKFDDFITYEAQTKKWTIVGVGNDGSRYTHSIKEFPKGKMQAGQQWHAETTGTTADGKPTAGSLHFIATTADSYEITIRETIDGEEMPNRKLVVKRRSPKVETSSSQSWREFLIGTWTRDTTEKSDGKSQDSRTKWQCVSSGNALVSYGTSSDPGYGTLLYWDDQLGKLVEQGHSSEGHWKIEFDLQDETKGTGSIIGRLADGRTSIGTILVERTSETSYTAKIKMELSDGETMEIADRNVRQ